MREVRKPSLGLNSARIPPAVAAPVGGSPNCEMGCRAFGTLGLRCANPSPIRTPPRLRFATAPPVGGMSKKKDESRWECQVEYPSEVLLFLVLFVQPLFNLT